MSTSHFSADPLKALFWHYVEYLSSPGGVLAVAIVIVPLVLLRVYENRHNRPDAPIVSIEGCQPLGIQPYSNGSRRTRSNLDDQYQRLPDTTEIEVPRVKALFTHPVKSCRGVELSSSEVGPQGLKYDRLFSFAQLISKPAQPLENGQVSEPSSEWNHQWRFITQREFPRLALVRTELHVPQRRRESTKASEKSSKSSGSNSKRNRSRTRGSTLHGKLEEGSQSKDALLAQRVESWESNGGCLSITFTNDLDFHLSNPFASRSEEVTIRLPLMPTSERRKAKQYSRETLSIWKDSPEAYNVTNEIPAGDLAKLQYFLGVSNPFALFRVDEENLRSITRCLPTDAPGQEFKVGLADGFPVNILNIASVRALDDALPTKAELRGKLDARRFRANIYVQHHEPYIEDTWKIITTGRRLGRDSQGRFETDAEYYIACRCARCKLPNVDPATGVKDRNEPSTVLSKTRKVDESALPHPCLGVQVIPRFQVGVIRVGDEIDVVQTGSHCVGE